MNLLQRALGRRGEQRYSVNDWLADKAFSFNGIGYPVMGLGSANSPEEYDSSFTGYTQALYKSDGPVFATILARMLLFSEARFQWQRVEGGRPGDLFGTPELSLLERPWPNGTTGELLSRMEQDVSLAGNFYAVREGNRLRRLRPDWVEIVLSAPPAEAVGSDVVGYRYTPGGAAGGAEPVVYLREQVCHWSPIPDPDALYKGMSWLTPVLEEIRADKGATRHKGRFFDNAATPSLTVSFKETVTEQQFDEFMAQLKSSHQGADRAYKTMFLAGGADVKVVGADLKQMDFKQTQGAGETRICSAGGVPAIIVGLSEGLQAATYSNYGMARRKFGDHWARPQWRSACAALETIVRPPSAPSGTVRLWYDDRDIAFLREDERDRAEIQGLESRTIRTLLDAGYEGESVIAAVTESNWRRLVHTGLFSVQLQKPGTGQPGTADDNDEPAEGDDAGDGDDGNAA